MGLFLIGCKSGAGSSSFTETDGKGSQAGVAGTNATRSSASAPLGTAGNDSLDIIRVQDLLTVLMTDTPVLLPVFEDRVKDDGTITLTENQKFNVVGKNRGELADEIHDRYVPRFFKRMTVSVKKAENTQFYYVGGEVKTPTRQVYLGRISVLKAIQSAGWFTDYANKSKVQLTRGTDGRIFIINCKKALKNPKLDLEVYPGDTITVPRRSL